MAGKVVKIAEQTPQPMNLIDLVSAVVSRPDVDVSKVRDLLEMQREAEAEGRKRQFNIAMNEAQGKMSRIAADANNSQTRSKYASYGQLDRVLRPIYTEHGFSISYDTDPEHAPENYVRVLAKVRHIAGHEENYKADIPADGKGAKGGDVMTKTHAAGSAMTYGQRYLLKLIFNVAIGENDDDGNAASVRTPLPASTISAAQVSQLETLIEEKGANELIFCKLFNVPSINSLSTSNFDVAKRFLDLRGKR